MDIPFADAALEWYVRRDGRRRPVMSIAELRLSAVRRVLLMLTTGLGDAVLSTPVFPNLRRALPAADIRLLCRAGWSGLFTHDPDLNGVIEYHGKYRRFFFTLDALKRFAPDLCLVLHGNDPDIIPLAYLAGSRYIARIPWSTTRFDWLLSNRSRPEDATTLPGRHYIENRLRILDTIGVAAADRFPRVQIGREAWFSARAKVPTLADGGRGYWVYHGFAADLYKTWPVAKAKILLSDALERIPELKVVATGSARQRTALEEILRGLPTERAINTAGSLSMAETAAVLAGAKCVVGPDTGVLHLAAALGVPVVGLYAPTSANLVGPRSRTGKVRIVQKPPVESPCPEKKCLRVPHCCMDQIEVGEVLQALAESVIP